MAIHQSLKFVLSSAQLLFEDEFSCLISFLHLFKHFLFFLPSFCLHFLNLRVALKTFHLIPYRRFNFCILSLSLCCLALFFLFFSFNPSLSFFSNCFSCFSFIFSKKASFVGLYRSSTDTSRLMSLQAVCVHWQNGYIWTLTPFVSLLLHFICLVVHWTIVGRQVEHLKVLASNPSVYFESHCPKQKLFSNSNIPQSRIYNACWNFFVLQKFWVFPFVFFTA